MRPMLLFLTFLSWPSPHLVFAQNSQREKTIVIRSLSPKPQGGRLAAYGITRSDMKRIQAMVPTVTSMLPIRKIPQARVRAGESTVDSVILGTTENYLDAFGLRVERGRFLTAKDTKERNNVAVISQNVASKLFSLQDPVGEVIFFSNQYFTIVGVFRADDDGNPIVVIPITTMQSRLGDTVLLRNEGSFESSSYELSELRIGVEREQLKETAATIQAILIKYHDKKDFEIGTP